MKLLRILHDIYWVLYGLVGMTFGLAFGIPILIIGNAYGWETAVWVVLMLVGGYFLLGLAAERFEEERNKLYKQKRIKKSNGIHHG